MDKGWREVRVGDIADVIVSNVDKKSRPGEQPVRLCNYTDVQKNHAVRPGMGLMTATATCAEIERVGLRVGDVLITKDSEDPNDIAVSGHRRRNGSRSRMRLSLGHCPSWSRGRWPFPEILLRPSPNSHLFRPMGQPDSASPSVAHERAVLRIPSLQEQRRIARILRPWDDAIQPMSQHAQALIRQQRGLMHVLIADERCADGTEQDAHYFATTLNSEKT